MSYYSDITGLLAMVDRGCKRLMREGGGALPREKPNAHGVKRITPEQIERIHELGRAGTYRQYEIGAIVGCSQVTVWKHLKRAGIASPDCRSLRVPKGKIELAKSMAYSRMYSPRQIREATGCSFSTVYRLVSERNSAARQQEVAA